MATDYMSLDSPLLSLLDAAVLIETPMTKLFGLWKHTHHQAKRTIGSTDPVSIVEQYPHFLHTFILTSIP